MLRVGWFTTARGPGSRGMYEAVQSAIDAGDLDARLAYVFCNRERGEDAVTDRFFDRVDQRSDTPLVTLSSVGYRREQGGARSRPGEALPAWRAAYDHEVAGLIASHPTDLIVLAGYMLIFSAGFVAGRTILNLHPALPDGPAGTWREVIRELIRARARESGVMTHLVVPELDVGPVAAYCRYDLHDAAIEPLWAELEPEIDRLDGEAIESSALFQAIRERGLAREAPFLVAVLAAFAEGRLRADGASLVAPEPLDLTDVVERRLSDRPPSGAP